MLKFAFNAVDDGLVGQQVFAGEATRLAYGTDEAVEGRDAFLEKRDPDWAPTLAVLSVRARNSTDPRPRRGRPARRPDAAASTASMRGVASGDEARSARG